MKRPLSLFAAGLMLSVLSAPAFAQQEAGVPTQERVIHRGDLDIVVQGAPEDDLNIAQYRAFDRFAGDHPEIVETLKENPKLLDNDKFLAQHPELAEFLGAHPDIKPDFDANPGNYVALAANVERIVEIRSQRMELVSPLPSDARQSQQL